ncbi:TPA_asm: P5 [Fraxinus gammacytorhabdovirus 2]|nr:TPA_asm: P5 [Fraxinus gammacytorhabdovirus 2]
MHNTSNDLKFPEINKDSYFNVFFLSLLIIFKVIFLLCLYKIKRVNARIIRGIQRL